MNVFYYRHNNKQQNLNYQIDLIFITQFEILLTRHQELIIL